jgi:trehalose synthase
VTSPARRLRRLPTAVVLGHEVPVAIGLRARLLGLAHLDRERAGSGLSIPRCRGVHTFGMRFALDLVFLDRDGRPISVRRAVPPRRLAWDRRASAVLELPSRSGERAAAARWEARLETMTTREVNVPSLSLDRLFGVIDQEARADFEAGLRRAAQLLDSRKIWNVNSTSSGGGVAEMLWSWVGLARGIDIDMRWLTIAGFADFFTLTKRLHNYLHGEVGDGGSLGAPERAAFERVSEENATGVLARMGEHDIAFLHDPQTAGLIPQLAEAGRTVVWRCHVGADERNELTDAAWDFLAPYVTRADAVVFSRRAYVPACCEGMVTAIVPPSIDAFSPKNQEMEPARVRAILRRAGLLAQGDSEETGEEIEPTFERPDGSEAEVERRCEVAGEGEVPGADVKLVVQVSRWDRLKDPAGVMHGFAAMLESGHDAWLVLAGPSLGSVTDDPDGAAVLSEIEADRRRLPDRIRARVLLACLPTEDLAENAAIVNALQRQATLVVQKSLKEGFGLTVTEAMWKARPVVASATGGIVDQIEDGVTGVLLAKPLDLSAFADAVGDLLGDPEHALAMGEAARASVRANFLEDRHTLQYVELLERLLAP